MQSDKWEGPRKATERRQDFSEDNSDAVEKEVLGTEYAKLSGITPPQGRCLKTWKITKETRRVCVKPYRIVAYCPGKQ